MAQSERQFGLVMWGAARGPVGRWPQAWRAARLFHGQDDDEQGLVQAAVVELGRLAEGLGDKLVSVLEFFLDREFIGMHVYKG
jgi:hypothetical protein